MSHNLSAFAYLLASVCFIMALRGLSSPVTARAGNLYGVAGMVIAVATTLASPGVLSYWLILLGVLIGGSIGTVVALRIQMTALPQLVAAFHSLVGLAAVFVAAAAFYQPDAYGIGTFGQIPAGSLVEMAAGLASAVVLFGYAWWAPIVLAGGWLATHWLLRESSIWRDRNTDDVRAAQRHADYAFRLAVDPPAAKEVRLFGLVGWTIERFVAHRQELFELQHRATRLRERPVIWSLLVVTAANVAVFWSLANDLYTPEQGKRLFAILGIGGSVGAVAGSYLAKLLFKPLGPYLIMLLSAAILVLCLGLSWVANAREGRAGAAAKHTSMAKAMSFRLIDPSSRSVWRWCVCPVGPGKAAEVPAQGERRIWRRTGEPAGAGSADTGSRSTVQRPISPSPRVKSA